MISVTIVLMWRILSSWIVMVMGWVTCVRVPYYSVAVSVM